MQAFAHIFFSLSQNMRMGLIFLRTVIIFITLFLVMRLMGKRQIGEMQPYELVITLVISDLACIPMGDNAVPLLYGVVAVLTVYLLHQIVCLIDLKWKGAKTVLSGSPSIVLNKRGIDDEELKKNNLDVSDLIAGLRIEGYFALEGIEYALYESEGTFSALPKENYEGMQTSLPLVIVNEGAFDEKNLLVTGKDAGYFRDVLKGQGCDELKNVLIMTVDGDGKVYLQKRGESYQVFRLNWEKRVW